MTGDSTRTVAARSAGIATATLTSRATGFLRTVSLSAALGAGLVGNSYATALMLPGIVYEILLGGIGTAVLLPLLHRAQSKGDKYANDFTARIISVSILAFGTVVVVLMAMLPLVIPLLGGSSVSAESNRLAIQLSLFTVPTIAAYGVAATLTACLHSHKAFGVPAIAPMANNVTLIAAATILLLTPASTSNSTTIGVLGTATLAGAMLQVLLLKRTLQRVTGYRWSWQPSLRGYGLRSLARTLGWVIAYTAIAQAGTIVTLGLLRASSTTGPMIYNNAWIILMMAYGVVALPIITSSAPDLTAHAAESHQKAHEGYRHASRLVLIVAIPTSLVGAALAVPITRFVFNWGRYTDADATATGQVLAVGLIALAPYAISQLQLWVFLSLRDAKTPTMVMACGSLLRIVLCVAVVTFLQSDLTGIGLIAAWGIGNLLVALVGDVAFRYRCRRR
ncbi:lipid II flippase MurJ [Haloglycomyces albus]|uniref:lipid II flippase MurJ n=1 Tax=Haloglycomyces albus TaxID=526067 RepID=UPI0004ADB565|nr:lipid II flippase MurJ [Haloglycomyces albus]